MVTVPIGFTTRDIKPIPLGIEILARRFDEAKALRVAYLYEQATHRRRPPPAYE